MSRWETSASGVQRLVLDQATTTPVTAATSSTVIIPAGTRMAAYVENASTATLYLKFGTGASSASRSFKVDPGEVYEQPQPIYCGTIEGVWTAADGGQANVTVVN